MFMVYRLEKKTFRLFCLLNVHNLKYTNLHVLALSHRCKWVFLFALNDSDIGFVFLGSDSLNLRGKMIVARQKQSKNVGKKKDKGCEHLLRETEDGSELSLSLTQTFILNANQDG